jgi:hypothetical protein
MEDHMDNEDGLDLPEFLKISRADRKAAWKGVKLTSTETKVRGVNYALPKTLDPGSLALLKSIEADKAAKTKAKFAALREKKK